MMDVVFTIFVIIMLVIVTTCMLLWLFGSLFPETVQAMNDRLDKAMADRVRKA